MIVTAEADLRKGTFSGKEEYEVEGQPTERKGENDRISNRKTKCSYSGRRGGVQALLPNSQALQCMLM